MRWVRIRKDAFRHYVRLPHLLWSRIPREHRLLQKPLRISGPELADVVVRLDGLVDQLAVLLLNAPEIDVDDDVAVIVEADGTARRFRDLKAVPDGREISVVEPVETLPRTLDVPDVELLPA